ncbi:MAG: hypothetical protein QOG25_3747 [Acetobacteraceae bacterium]|nr:hypothetical protein [Acetobacteraceae bacterium]
MQRTSFDFDVITGPVPPRPAPKPQSSLTPQKTNRALKKERKMIARLRRRRLLVNSNGVAR